MGVTTRQHPERLVRGELLVPKDTPDGAPEARTAWARELGVLIEVVEVARGGLDVLYELKGRQFVESADEIAARGYERAGGTAI